MKKLALFAFALVTIIGLNRCAEEKENNVKDTNNKSETNGPVKLPSEDVEVLTPVPSEQPFDPGTKGANWNVDFSRTNVRWECGAAGTKLYSHFGEVKMKEAQLTTDADRVKSGMFVIDMTTIAPQDPNYTADQTASKLAQHLKSAEFFDVANYPEASFVITSVDKEHVTGDLTVKGQTKQVNMIVDMVAAQPDGSLMAHGVLRFSRKDFGLNWAFPMKDMILNDMIDVHVEVWAKLRK